MDQQTQPNPPAPPTNDGKKSLSGGAKVGIGCGIIAILGLIVVLVLVDRCQKFVGGIAKDFAENPERAAAELFIRANPNLEMVSSDDANETFTFRDKQTGEESTMNWGEIREGNITIPGPDGSELRLGSAGMENVPDWVPQLPGTTRSAANYQQVADGKTRGSIVFGTTSTTDEIVSFFTEHAEKLGMEASTNERMSGWHEGLQMLEFKDEERMFTAQITREGTGDAAVIVVYEGKSED